MGFPQAQASVCAMDCSNSSLTEQFLCSVIRHLLALTHAALSASYRPNIVRLLHILVFNFKLGVSDPVCVRFDYKCPIVNYSLH